MNQYRIKLNGDYRPITDECPSDVWSRLAEAYEFRGGIRAQLERRLVTDTGIFDFIPDGRERGYIQIDENTVICPWEIIAELVD